MPSPEMFLSDEAFYSTLFHELTHSTGHQSRLARKGNHGGQPVPVARVFKGRTRRGNGRGVSVRTLRDSSLKFRTTQQRI